MDKKNKHSIHSTDKPQDSHKFLAGLEVPWAKSKEQIWQELSGQLEEQPFIKIRRISPSVYRYAVAAVILLLVGLALFMRLYTKEVISFAGEHISITLPCNSTVELNANSSLSYHPLWWRFSRKLHLDGEAYFEVEKGKSFEVSSSLGKTAVLGTTFNIFSRQEEYKVTCLSGSVKVTSQISNEKVILKPNESAKLDKDGNVSIHQNINAKQSTAWTRNEFIFTSKPLREVFDEIERQYDVSIDIPGGMTFVYTGNFAKEASVDSVLDMICKPFGISFVKQEEGEYLIIQKR